MYPVPKSLNFLILFLRGLWLYNLNLHYFTWRCGINQTLCTLGCHCCPLGLVILTHTCFCFPSCTCEQWFWTVITCTVCYWWFTIFLHARNTASLSELTGCCSRHIHSLHSCHLLWLWTWEGTVSHLSYRLPLRSGHVEPILSHGRSSLFHGNKWDMIAWSGVSFKQTTLLCSCFDTCSLLRLLFCTLSALLLGVPGWLFYCLVFFIPGNSLMLYYVSS